MAIFTLLAQGQLMRVIIQMTGIAGSFEFYLKNWLDMTVITGDL